MARLTCAPIFLAALASKPAKPVKPAVPRCAPIQSAASTTKASIARPSLSKSAFARTLRAGSKALQQLQAARDAPTVSSRTNLCAYRALSNNSDRNGSSTDCDQNKRNSKQQTRIPGPEIEKTIAKWAKTRKHHVIRYQVCVKEKKNEIEGFDESSFMSDTNPDRLHDESFDETCDPYEQSSMQTILRRFQALSNVPKHPKGVVGRHPGVLVPSYGGGDHFKFGRKRPRVVAPPKGARGIPQKFGFTLKYKKIEHVPAPSAKILEQIKAEKRFGLGFKLPVEPKVAQDLPSEPASKPSEAVIFDITKSSGNEPRSDSGADVLLKTTTTDSSEPATKGKVVHFSEEPVEPLLYLREACAKDVKTLFEIGDDWTPIKRNCTYSNSSQSIGFDTMFMEIGLNSISLKRRVAIRFKAVQEYEKRRHQNSIDAGENPTLGQLDYGNADYRIAMQVSDVVTAHDIGTLIDQSKFNLPASMCSGPLLHFGSFAEGMGSSFENTLIPARAAAAYRMPVQWYRAPKHQDALDKWVASAFPSLQPAKLEEYDEGEN